MNIKATEILAKDKSCELKNLNKDSFCITTLEDYIFINRCHRSREDSRRRLLFTSKTLSCYCNAFAACQQHHRESIPSEIMMKGFREFCTNFSIKLIQIPIDNIWTNEIFCLSISCIYAFNSNFRLVCWTNNVCLTLLFRLFNFPRSPLSGIACRRNGLLLKRNTNRPPVSSRLINLPVYS